MLKSLKILTAGFFYIDKWIFYNFLFILLFSICISFLELVGLSILGSFVFFLSNQDIFFQKFSDYSFVNFLLSLDNNERVVFFLISIVIFFIIKNLTIFLYLYLFNKLKLDFSYDISKKTLISVLKEKYIFFLNKKKSNMIHNVKDETIKVIGVYFSVLNIIKEIFLIIFLLFSILIVNWKVSILVFLLLSLLSFAIIQFIKKKLYFYGKLNNKLSSIILNRFYELFNDLKYIKLKNSEDYFSKNITKIQKENFKVSFLQNILISIPRLLLEVFAVTGLCVVIFYSLRTSYSFNELLPFFTFLSMCLIRMVPAIAGLNNNISNINTNFYSVEVISEYLNKNTNNLEWNRNSLLPKKNVRNIIIKDVSFDYLSSEKKFYLKNINFELFQKDILGIVGKSGSGKTTLVDIILGLLPTKTGKIKINDSDDISSVNISYVAQNINLIDDTLLNNITAGLDKNKINTQKVDYYLDLVELSEFKKHINDKIFGESALQVSGGQKQKVGIARALYDEPNILILDEPTSNLDPEAEEKIINNIKKLNIDIIIIIAHRLASLNICNKLLILEDGMIQNFGKKEEIIKDNFSLSRYFEKY